MCNFFETHSLGRHCRELVFLESMLNRWQSRKLSVPSSIMALNKDGLHHRYTSFLGASSWCWVTLSLIVTEQYGWNLFFFKFVSFTKLKIMIKKFRWPKFHCGLDSKRSSYIIFWKFLIFSTFRIFPLSDSRSSNRKEDRHCRKWAFRISCRCTAQQGTWNVSVFPIGS